MCKKGNFSCTRHSEIIFLAACHSEARSTEESLENGVEPIRVAIFLSAENKSIADLNLGK